MYRHKRLFYLNSANRASGIDACNMTLQIDIPTHEVFTHAVIVEANIPKSYYLIQAGYNFFTLEEMGENLLITIPPGNYSATSFRTVVSTLMTAASATAGHNWTYTISYPTGATVPNTGKFTYSVTGNGANQPSIVTTTNVFEQLGFAANSTNTFVASTLTSTNVVKFVAEDSLYLHSDLISGGGDDVLQEIYTSGIPDFAIISYKSPDLSALSKPLQPQKGNVYRFSLTDENNRTMNLNGLNWTATLLVYSETRPLSLTLE